MKFQERWNQRKLWLTDELVAPSFVLHTSEGDIDLATFKEAVGSYLLSFPDSQVILEDALAAEMVHSLHLQWHTLCRLHEHQGYRETNAVQRYGVLPRLVAGRLLRGGSLKTPWGLADFWSRSLNIVWIEMNIAVCKSIRFAHLLAQTEAGASAKKTAERLLAFVVIVNCVKVCKKRYNESLKLGLSRRMNHAKRDTNII